MMLLGAIKCPMVYGMMLKFNIRNITPPIFLPAQTNLTAQLGMHTWQRIPRRSPPRDRCGAWQKC